MTIALAHEISGPRNGSANAPVVVLLGSLGSNRSMWDPQVAALSDECRVVAVDQRGHGESPVPDGPYSVRELSEDVLALLDSLRVDAAHIVGLSMGGAIGQWLGVNAPRRVLSLSLLCTAAKFGEPQAWIEQAAASRSDGPASLADSVVARWFSEELAERDPEFVARYRAMIASTPAEGYAACCDALGDWDFTADLSRITAPALVIAGEQDPSTTPSVMQILADGITGARFEVLPGAAHLANLEQAGAVTALLREHIVGGVYAPGRLAAHAAGMKVRRSVLGNGHVDRSVEEVTEFTAPFQDFITRTAWGDIWSRPGLDREMRRLLTIAVLTAVGNEHELDMHIRAALRAGVDSDTIGEVLLHTAVYAGVPNSNLGFALGKRALADLSSTDTGHTRVSDTGHKRVSDTEEDFRT
ncbi:bifunctional 3-oxoadipate enol-lactonase/4-carboxymuconolactone decarboxylase PcaDC [Rhodococcus marinonascens]|uniref:bifunctional 3-oxoadipate enol-lactonase/4-carboxymuconolactone decarboxylase PcaDC n=1 Tax=Rhodococcus marinonascens TaxID=38311 RepID=UPI000934B202|nr:3-oxoadipate enol-lactonase [Rhodococcus marinonascens]